LAPTAPLTARQPGSRWPGEMTASPVRVGKAALVEQAAPV
jgi:hypothetical protein